MTVVVELVPAPDPADAFARLASWPGCLFLDSARHDEGLGRYSFIAADPFGVVEAPVGAADPIGEVARRLAPFRCPAVPELPPFQGGAAGLFGYDLGRSLERLPTPRFDEFQFPALVVGLYDAVVAFDHQLGRAWIVSQGFPETKVADRERRAVQRAAELQRRLDSRRAVVAPETCRYGAGRGNLDARELAPQFPVPGPVGLTSNFDRDDYLRTVARAIEYIVAGDIFQVNLAQRLLIPAAGDPVALYLRLRRRNPAPFAGYFDAGGFQIVSASPERFLAVRDREVEARPIKGTRRRAPLPEADLFVGDELRASEKDVAENVMIVDLLRNDLSRSCRPESVHVPQLCRLETYEFVQHLVSVVRGQLRDDVSPLELLARAFPGGSITGAPKVRAMEIIAELEPTARGAYCGALGYLGFDGTLDTNILIRTIVAGRGWWQFAVGGGIVAQSNPEREYQETWHKAEGLLRSLAAD